MGFDWDKLEDAPKVEGGFDWDEHEDVTPDKDRSSKIETGLMHGLQGATGGFLDEASGLGEAAGRVVGVKGLGGKFSDVGLSDEGAFPKLDVLKQAYKNARDKKRAILAQQAADHEGIAGVSNVAGAVVSPLNKLTKGMSLMRAGAGIGGLTALGSSEADLTEGDFAGAGIDTAIGVGTGALVGKAIDKASPAAEKARAYMASKSRRAAEHLAARAKGAERGTIKSLGAERVRKAGAQSLDEGELSAFGNTQDLIARNAATKAKGGKMMGEAYDAIDDAGASTFNPREVAEKVDDEVGNFWRSPLNKGEANQFDNTIESILERGPGDIPLREAQILKEELQAAANWKNKLNPTAKEQLARDAYGIVSKQIDEAVSVGGKAIDKAGLTETLTKGKSLFANASTGEKLLENKLAREQGNKIIMRSPKLADLAQRSPKAFNAMVANIAERTQGKLGGAASKVAGPGQMPVNEEQAQSDFIEGN